jgi:hypothetical protein
MNEQSSTVWFLVACAPLLACVGDDPIGSLAPAAVDRGNVDAGGGTDAGPTGSAAVGRCAFGSSHFGDSCKLGP